ncbi:MAG TPA: rhomboid family intramembrane serine protease [Armatimonadota bacterium]|nr:rhomboid family intramembrane serine protease [Armatimonadota bacterium]HOJ20639.1 rhomboid family intramembrane serine protease [Armatimonadota bacterium]HPO74269.1 rhomboid family intramembrane serine protease [Armatimonadota bacterium]
MLIPIPYATDRELRHFPIVTLFLVGLNCSLFLLSLMGGTLTLDYIVQNYGLRGDAPEIATLFSSMLLHASALHLLVNVTYLWLFGCLVEDVLGRVEYMLFYLGSGMAGGLLYVVVVQKVLPAVAATPLVTPEPAVGASGAVAGILGLFAIRFYRAKIKMLLLVPIAIPALPAIGFWVGIQGACAVSSLSTGVNTGCWAHLGGFAFGILSGCLMRVVPVAEEEYFFEDVERDLAENNVKSALRRLHEKQGSSPDDPKVHCLLAKAYEKSGSPDVADMHARLSVELALEKGDLETAVANYLAVKGVLSVLAMEAQYRIACALESQRRTAEAAAAYRRVYHYYPEEPLAGTALIRCVEMLRRRPEGAEEAAALAREYLERYPEGEWRAQAERYARSAPFRDGNG